MDNNEISVNTLDKKFRDLEALEDECFFLITFDKGGNAVYHLRAKVSDEKFLYYLRRAVTRLSNTFVDYRKKLNSSNEINA